VAAKTRWKSLSTKAARIRKARIREGKSFTKKLAASTSAVVPIIFPEQQRNSVK
jgi:hypothetical protein